MNPADMLRIVDSLHREKAIEKEIVFQAIEAALITAAKKHYGELEDIVVTINRETGEITGTHEGQPMDEAEISGRIGAQTAKQVIIQKIREAERDSLLGKFGAEIGAMITGVVTRNEGPATIVAFDGIEAILPRSQQIPGESHHPNERVRAIIFEVKPQGSRVKVVLSRTRPQLVQRLFEQEIPEIADGVITIQAIAREPGHRSKVAVSSSDQRVDCVGACVGVRGNRIKNIVEELAERLVEQGYLSYDDLSVIEPDALMEMGSMTEEQVQHIVDQADVLAQQAEKAADEERRRKKAEDAAAAAAGEAAPSTAAATAAAQTPETPV